MRTQAKLGGIMGDTQQSSTHTAQEPRTHFDYTMMSTFQTCRRRYDLRFNKGWDLKEPSLAPFFGAAIHKGLDAFYAGKGVQEAIEAFRGAYTENKAQDEKRTYEMGEWIIKNYSAQYQDQAWVTIEQEQAFEQGLPNGNTFMGRIDKIIKWGDLLWVVDHKTTSSLGGAYFNGYEPSLQMPGYVWAMKQRGMKIAGVVVDALLVAKGLMPGKGKNYNLTPLARYDIYYKEEQLTEWLETVQEIQYQIRECEKRDQWCPNFDACTYYGECPYRRVCKEEKGIRERILNQDYTINFWDPRKGAENAA